MNVLHVCANPRPVNESVSKQLALAFFAKLTEVNPDVNVSNVDLYQGQTPPPFLSYPQFRAIYQPVIQEGYEATKAEYNSAAYARSQAEELKKADLLVLTMPLWNFSMPAIMKAWLDQAVIPGTVYEFEADGTVKPLHQIQKVILLVASADVFKEDDPRDALTPQVRALFEFIGVTDIAVAWADGQHPSFEDREERKQVAIEAAQELAEDTVELAGAGASPAAEG